MISLQLAVAVFDGTVEEMAVGLKEQEREIADWKPEEPIRPPELEA